MIYKFQAKQVVDIFGEVEADTESEAIAIVERITANVTSDQAVTFENRSSVDYFEVDICEDVDIDNIEVVD